MRSASMSARPMFQEEGRFAIECPATLRVGDSELLEASLVNISRHGYRVTIPRNLPAGEVVCLMVDAWPHLVSRVVWSQDHRAGCIFIMPPGVKAFAEMCRSVTGIDRDGC